jgi:lichenan operon transcriptional antiterminator
MTINGLQKKLLRMLAQASRPLSAAAMANRAGVSARTVRLNLSQLTDYFQQHQVKLEVRTGAGYSLTPCQPQALAALTAALEDEPEELPLQANEERAHFLIRTLLAGETISQIEDINGLFYINSTSSKHVLTLARGILAQFGLTARFTRRDGLKCEGSEMARRQCLVYEESFCLPAHSTGGSGELAFRRLVGSGMEARDALTRIVIDCQNEFTAMNLSAYSVSYLSALLYVSALRNSQGCTLELDQDTVSRFSQGDIYYTARKIAVRAGEELNTEFSRDDIILVAMALAAFRVRAADRLSADYSLEDKDLALDVVQSIAEVNQLHFIAHDPVVIEQLAAAVGPAAIRSRYHFLTSQFITQGRPDISLMAGKMAVQGAVYLHDAAGIDLTQEDIIHLAMLIHPIFGRFKWKFRRIATAVISGVDKSAGSGIRERLLRNFGVFIERIDLLEPYEAAVRDLSSYPVLFTDIPGLTLANDTFRGIILYAPITMNEQEKAVIRQQLTNYISRTNVEDRFLDSLNIETEIAVKNRADCLDLIARRINQDNGMEQDIAGDLERYEHYDPADPVNNAVVITGCYSHCWNMSVTFFLLKKAIVWHGSQKTRVVIYWDKGMQESDLEMFESEFYPHVIDLLRRDPECMSRLMKEPTLETLKQLVHEKTNIVMLNNNNYIKM